MSLILDTLRVHNALYLLVDSDPRIGTGALAGIGSLAIDPDGLMYQKTGFGNTDWDLVVNPAQTPGPPGPSGPPGPVAGYCGSFFSNQTQLNPVASQVNLFTCNNTVISNGITLVNSTQFKASTLGNFNIQFSAQMDKTSAGSPQDFDIWLRINGLDELWTNTQVTIQGFNQKVVAAWNWLVPANANDYFEIAWSSSDSGMRALSIGPQVGPIRPGIPSVIVTVSQVT